MPIDTAPSFLRGGRRIRTKTDEVERTAALEGEPRDGQVLGVGDEEGGPARVRGPGEPHCSGWRGMGGNLSGVSFCLTVDHSDK